LEKIHLLKKILIISIVVFVVAFLQKDRLPDKSDIVQELYQEPIQTPTEAVPLTVHQKGVTYTITPLYDYEFYGLVVSYHHSSAFDDYYHREWGDFINTKDICVIWGDNIETEIYKKLKFSSGSWTCYVKFSSQTAQEASRKFNHACLSNNHLLAANKEVSRAIKSVERGDQVAFKGFLVNYDKDNIKSFRTTSTTRKDYGCEVVYVTEATILKKANMLWRYLFQLTKYIMIIAGIFLIITLIRKASKEDLEN
jgi:hypothetical protein